MKEQDLFNYLKGTHYPDLERSAGTYDSFDCISASEKMYIELKSRLTHYATLLIEFDKYHALVDGAGYRTLTPWYINSTPEGVYAFNLGKMIEPLWVEKWMPTTTEFTDKSKKTKLVAFLSIDKAVRL